MSRLDLAPGLALPVEAATQTFLVVGKRGSGKSTTCVRLAEQLIKVHVPVIVVDPVDRWWGLKASRSGAGPGLSVYVFGGAHADLPLEPTAGALVADTIIEHRISAVLSVKHLSGRDRGRFVSDLTGRLFQANQEPLHVFLEEAHEVAPQQPFKGEEEMVGRVTRLWKRGRSSGIGGSAITQRPASLSKNITTQAEILIVHRTLGPQDVAAVREWIRYHGERDDILGELATLKTGEAFVWAPDFPEGHPIGLKRVQIFDRETFDSSATPKVGARVIQPKKLAPVDLDRLKTKMAATIEKAKADDPRELRRVIAELRAAALRNTPHPVAPPHPTVVTKEIPAIAPKLVQRIETLGAKMLTETARHSQVMAVFWEEQQKCWQAVLDALRSVVGARATAVPLRPVTPITEGRHGRTTDAAFIPVPRGPRRLDQGILDAIRWWQAVGIPQPTRQQVSFVSGRTIGGYFNNTVSRLHTDGLVEYPTAGALALTEAGQRQAHPHPAPPTPEALFAMIRATLGTDLKRQIFDTLIEAGKPLAREEIAQRVGRTVGGYFNNSVSRLSSLGIVHYPSPGLVGLSDLVVNFG